MTQKGGKCWGDSSVVFVNRKPEGDAALRRQIRPPKDFISTLSLESGGSVWRMSAFGPERSNAKRAGSALAAAAALRAQPPPCQTCDCLPSRDGQGELLCRRCVLPQVDIVLQNWREQQRLEEEERRRKETNRSL